MEPLLRGRGDGVPLEGMVDRHLAVRQNDAHCSRLEDRVARSAMRTLTDFLFTRPSFLAGVARLLDLGAQIDVYNQSATPSEADARALYSDWRMVGEDLHTAIKANTPVQTHP
jgi:hypothetical protein